MGLAGGGGEEKGEHERGLAIGGKDESKVEGEGRRVGRVPGQGNAIWQAGQEERNMSAGLILVHSGGFLYTDSTAAAV